MPLYSFRFLTSDGYRDGEDLGFYRDEAAIEHARKLANGASVEVRRSAVLIAVIEGPPTRPSAAANREPRDLAAAE